MCTHVCVCACVNFCFNLSRFYCINLLLLYKYLSNNKIDKEIEFKRIREYVLTDILYFTIKRSVKRFERNDEVLRNRPVTSQTS